MTGTARLTGAENVTPVTDTVPINMITIGGQNAARHTKKDMSARHGALRSSGKNGDARKSGKSAEPQSAVNMSEKCICNRSASSSENTKKKCAGFITAMMNPFLNTSICAVLS